MQDRGLNEEPVEHDAEAPIDALTQEASADSSRYTPEQVRRARELLTRIYGARRAIRFYPETHPATKEALERLAEVVAAYHSEDRPVALSLHGGEVFLGEQLLPEETKAFSQLIGDLEAIGVGSIVIDEGVTLDGLRSLISVLASDSTEIAEAGGPDKLLEKLGGTRIRITTLVAAERVAVRRGESAEAAWEAYSGAIELLREVDRLGKGANATPAAGQIRGSVRSLVDSILTNRMAMLRLAGLKDYDEYTYYHSANVAVLSLALGSMITTEHRFLAALGMGALLHDLGKLTIDLEILNKESELTSEEWAKMEEHPQIGASMVAAMSGIDSTAVVTILEHHMQVDGQGYPTTTSGRGQHLASRIVAVADAFDAMTSKRSYSPALLQDEAMRVLLESRGTKLDPTLVDLFVRALGVFPPRSLVLLVDGRMAVVLEPGAEDPMRPVVRIIAEADGTLTDPVDVDLAAEPSITVDRCIDPELVAVEIADFL